jgi:hypothetical protein
MPTLHQEHMVLHAVVPHIKPWSFWVQTLPLRGRHMFLFCTTHRQCVLHSRLAGGVLRSQSRHTRPHHNNLGMACSPVSACVVFLNLAAAAVKPLLFGGSAVRCCVWMCFGLKSPRCATSAAVSCCRATLQVAGCSSGVFFGFAGLSVCQMAFTCLLCCCLSLVSRFVVWLSVRSGGEF